VTQRGFRQHMLYMSLVSFAPLLFVASVSNFRFLSRAGLCKCYFSVVFFFSSPPVVEGLGATTCSCVQTADSRNSFALHPCRVNGRRVVGRYTRVKQASASYHFDGLLIVSGISMWLQLLFLSAGLRNLLFQRWSVFSMLVSLARWMFTF
jgi:hypothetical protein